ncbi:zinc ribbon domain-containing protein [Bacillus sp. H-16]|uniref:zinc ribbon domain-containing protein n=1 Tax=Alteribacter salitolerans TaxID=2912333 RepID=UPI001965B452|nr:zinc ribbon domain-containing protein [Alteribacter salitolerans]MBM7095747.1 zinc ribbon domain-containing protein [Alteribacter salitolerans]
MFCSGCGSQMADHTKFCGKCGTAAEVQAASNETAAASEPVQAGTSGNDIKDNVYVKQGKEVGSMYLAFALAAIKAPFTTAKQTDETGFVNGIISILLFSVFYSLTSYNLIGSFVSFWEGALVPAFLLTVTFFLFAGVMTLVLKLMNVGATYKNVLARYGALLVFPGALAMFGFVLALLSLNFLGVFIALMSVVFIPLTFFGTMFSFERKGPGGLDAFYGIVLTNVLIMIISILTLASMVQRMIEEITSSFWFL